MATTFDVINDLVRGEEIFLYLTSGNTPLAFATTCTVQVDGETIDTSNKMSGRWNTALQGKNSYSITSDALYTRTEGHMSFDTLMGFMIDGTPVEWKVGKAKDYKNGNFEFDNTQPYYEGNGFVTSLSLNAGNNEVSNCSITITGNGAIESKKGGE